MFREALFDLESLAASLEEELESMITPFQNVFFMECIRMNGLIQTILSSLEVNWRHMLIFSCLNAQSLLCLFPVHQELDLAFKGDQQMTEAMEGLQACILQNRVPPGWCKMAYPSLRPLSSWLDNLKKRHQQLAGWVQNPSEVPMATWISGLFNPQAFLTAILQVRRIGQNVF